MALFLKVVFAGCSEGVILNHERTASINPKLIHTFTYDIEVFAKMGKRHYCTGNERHIYRCRELATIRLRDTIFTLNEVMDL